jgi:hypothetical protein
MPYWLSFPPQVLLLGCLGLLVLSGMWLTVRGSLRRERIEQARRSILDRLELATTRNLPLEGALRALAQDLEIRSEDKPQGLWKVLVEVVSPLPHMFGVWLVRRRLKGEVELVSDVQAGLQEGGLEAALRNAGDAFPAPFPQLLGAAERNGTLPAALEDLRELDRTSGAFRSEVRGQLVYPLAILFVIELAVQLQFWTVHQKLLVVLANYGGNASELWGAALLGLTLAVPLFLALAWALGGLVGVREGFLGGLVGRLPILGRARRVRDRGLVVGQLAAALRAGLDFPSALDAVDVASPHDLEPARRLALDGASPAEALAACPLLDDRARERLAALPNDPAGALADQRDVDRETQQRLLRLAARAVVPFSLCAIGTLVLAHYAFPFMIQRQIVENLLW